MKVIKSIQTTDAILAYSNIEEDEYPLWVSGQAWQAKARVIYDHKIYEAVLANSGTTPPTYDPTNWYFVEATNRYRMFDSVLSNTSSKAGLIHVTLQPMDVVESLVLLNLTASRTRVVVTDPLLGVIYDETRYLTSFDLITDFYSYFNSPVQSSKPNALFTDLPVAPTATIDVYIENGSGVAQVGEIVYGVLKVVGKTKYGTSIGIKSYSRKETDEFGRVTVVKRKNSKYADYDIDIDNENLADVQRFFAEIDSVPCVFIGNEDMDELVVYGFYNDFKAVISFVTVSTCTLRVEGLV